MKENLLNLIGLNNGLGFVIDEDKIDKGTIKCTNGIEVSIRDYIRIIALDVVEEVLTKMEENKNDGEEQNMS